MAQHGSRFIFCALFVLIGVGEHPLLVCVFLCFFFGTKDGDWRREELGAGEVLHTDAHVLDAEYEHLAQRPV